MKIYGPYTRKDGRMHVILYKNGKKTTMSYPRVLMEKELGRKLEKNETVDHIDENKSNNEINNLQILTNAENIHKHHIFAHHLWYECPICKIHFSRRKSSIRHNQVKYNKAGPFCGKKCAGKYGTDVQKRKKHGAE